MSQGKPPAVAVLGLGNWGTALANHLAMKGLKVCGWCIEPEIAASINSDNKNPLYQSQTKLDQNLSATNDLEQALLAPYVVLAFPSLALSSVVPKLEKAKSSTFISAIKGLEAKSLLTPLQYVESVLGPNLKLCVLSGPSFAVDVVAGKPAGVVAASKDIAIANEVTELFSGNLLRVYSSDDPLGVELGGVVKNVIALAAGVSDGLALGDSARAGLITRGLAEITRLAVAMGAKARTMSGLAGLGDLVMTASCDTSRNRTVGLRLGAGETLDHIIETLGSVAEGVKSTPLVLKLAEKYKVDMPITLAVSELLNGEINAQELVEKLLSRPAKKEFLD